jgi:hypothetical protein
MAELSTDIRDTVRERYANAAKAAATGAYDQARALESESGCCGTGAASCSPAHETGVFGACLYDEASRAQVPEAAVNASLGCGVRGSDVTHSASAYGKSDDRRLAPLATAVLGPGPRRGVDHGRDPV